MTRKVFGKLLPHDDPVRLWLSTCYSHLNQKYSGKKLTTSRKLKILIEELSYALFGEPCDVSDAGFEDFTSTVSRAAGKSILINTDDADLRAIKRLHDRATPKEKAILIKMMKKSIHWRDMEDIAYDGRPVGR